MTATSHEIVRHLPFMRRYARALLGEQRRGDNCVRVCLEALLVEPDRIEGEGDVRAQLYRLLHETLDRLVLAEEDAVEDPAAARLEQRIGTLPTVERSALLLVMLESFDLEDTAFILRRPASEVADLVERARAGLRTQAPTQVLVIEDEPVIALHLCDLVRELGHTVIGVASTRSEAVALARSTRPGLVLADIQLDDGSTGIEAVSEILGEFEVPVVFVTAFPERLLTGDRIEPTFLVTKPFEPDTLRAAMSQALLAKPAALAAAS